MLYRVFFMLVFFVPIILMAQTTHQSLRSGDEAYDNSKFQEAEQHYRKADEISQNPQAAYNLGNALYQQGKWADAARNFARVAQQAQTSAEKADALHNLGNAFLKSDQLPEAIRAYENSLRLRPGVADTKMNLQLAKKKLAEKEKKEKEKQQQQNQNQPNQNQKDQQNQQQPQKGQDPQNQQQPQNPGDPTQGEQPQQGQAQQNQPGKMSAGDARRLLETAISPEDQKNAKKYRSAQPQKPSKSDRKDW